MAQGQVQVRVAALMYFDLLMTRPCREAGWSCGCGSRLLFNSLRTGSDVAYVLLSCTLGREVLF